MRRYFPQGLARDRVFAIEIKKEMHLRQALKPMNILFWLRQGDTEKPV